MDVSINTAQVNLTTKGCNLRNITGFNVPEAQTGDHGASYAKLPGNVNVDLLGIYAFTRNANTYI